MSILHYIIIAVEVVLLFNLLIAVHELGHFLAAKWRGLRVDRFAIWFGKPLWKHKAGGVEYALGWIPAGGYVALPQMATMEAIEGKSETSEEPLPNVAPLDKIIVAFAGPLFSFLLAVGFACVVWWVGKPSDEADTTTTIGWVETGGPAWTAGLRPGDKILEVDGQPVRHFSPTSEDSVMWRIIASSGANIAIKYLRDGKEATVYAIPIHQPTKWYERKSLRQIMAASERKAIVGAVVSNSPAALAGLEPGDEIVAMDGSKIYNPLTIMDEEDSWSNSPPLPVTLTVKKPNGQEFEKKLLAVKPVQPANSTPMLGILAREEDTNEMLVHPKPWDQIQGSVGQVLATVSVLFSHKSDVGVQQLGGAVMIIRAYSSFFESENGWRWALWFSVILNVNLALINLLPLPVLDGGHILLSLLEAVRRRPLSVKILNSIQTGFAALIITFMLYIAFFDTSDWLRSVHDNQNVPVVFAPHK